MRPPADTGPPPSREEQRSNLFRFLLVIAVGVAIAVATGAFPAVVVVIAILLMIMLHETGHFATAKWTGMTLRRIEAHALLGERTYHAIQRRNLR